MGQERKIRNDTITKDAEGVGHWYNAFEVWHDNFNKVREIVDSMQPGQLESGAKEYGAFSKRMTSSANLIYNQATRMAEAWGGEDAKKAMENMNKTYRQVQEIERISDQTSKAMSAHAKTQHSWKNAYGSGSRMDSWVKDVVTWGHRILAINPATAPAAIGGLIGNNAGASSVMNHINDGTVESNNNFPPSIRQDLASPNVVETNPLGKEPGGPGGGPKAPKMPGGGGPGGGPGGMPGGPGDLPGGGPGGGPGGPGDLPGGPGGPNIPGGPNGPGVPGGPDGPDLPGGPGGLGGGPGGPGTDLASMPPGGPGGGPGLGGGGAGLGAGGVGGGPGALGGGLGAGPGGMGAGMGAGPGAFGGLGGKGGMNGMGMPMGAGARGGGGDGDEHERSTWLTEDEDVWGGNDDTAPPVIG